MATKTKKNTRDVEPEVLDAEENSFQNIEATLRKALGRMRHPIAGAAEDEEGDTIADTIAENPGVALLGAAALGWVVGKVLKRILP